MKLILNHFYLDRYHDRVKILGFIMQSYPMAGSGASGPSGRFIPPQPNSTDNSSQDTDNSNTTTVYYEKSTGGCQNKTTGIQTSPKDLEPTGTTTATQTSHKMASQAGGTQTTPPPPPRSQHQQEECKHPLQKTMHMNR